MKRYLSLYRSSIGAKFVMSVTGLALLGFLVGHLVGNLKVFEGQKAYNDYAAFLHSMPGPLWVARIGLLTVFLLHLHAAVRLATQNRAARPDRYRANRYLEASFASRHMFLTGLVVLAFVVYHLLHFTFRVVEVGEMHALEGGRPDVYTMVVSGFQVGWVSASYLVAMLLLGVHLVHATTSLFQTLGIRHPTATALIQPLAFLLTAFLVVGNCAIPLFCYFGNLTVGGGSG